MKAHKKRQATGVDIIHPRWQTVARKITDHLGEASHVATDPVQLRAAQELLQ